MAIEIVDIRHFAGRDFAALLAAESLAWINTLRWDYTCSARVISACLAEKRLSGYALLVDHEIQGYSFFVYDGTKALIGGLFIQPNGLFRPHAEQLLDHVVETVKAVPGVFRVEAQLPHFALEELESCFRQHGFSAYLRRFMLLPLVGRPAPDPPPERSTAEFAFEPWRRSHDGEAARLLAEVYRNHIDAVINDQYQSSRGTSRLIENIVQLRGCGESLSEASFVAVHRPTARLAGMVALTSVRPGTAHIPQVAVARSFQSHGLGAALMEMAFRTAERIGFREVSLTVTDRNADAVRFYKRLGFETFHTFGAFVWDRHSLVTSQAKASPAPRQTP